jgi:hypothetical protein
VFRAFLIIGAVVDLLAALFLVIIFGFILDSWNDPVMPWAGPIMTVFWSAAFILCAGAPIFGYWLSRRSAPHGRIALAVWLPTLVIIAVSAVALVLSPP